MIFCIIGAISILVAHQSNLAFKEAISNGYSDLDGKISSPGGFEDLDLEDIPLKLSNISIDSNLSVCFSVIIAVNIVAENNETFTIPFFGLDDNLLTRMNISDRNSIVTRMDQDLINVSSIDDSSKNYQISINENESIVNDWLFSSIIRKTQSYYSLQLKHDKYNYRKYFLMGNLSFCIEVAKELEITEANVGSFFYGFIDESILENFSPEEVLDIIDQYEKNLYLELVRIGIDPDYISISSSIDIDIHNTLVSIYSDIYDIQLLSIPNIVLIFLLIFTIDVGVNGILKSLRKKLWLKGFSDRKINTMFFIIEIIPDLAAFLLSMLLVLLLGQILNITNLLNITFVKTLGLTFIIIILCKVINFFFLNKTKRNGTTEESVSKRLSDRTLNIVKISSIVLLMLVVFMQIARVFTSLFWFPLINGSTKIIFDVFTAIILLLIIIILFSSKFKGKSVFSKQSKLRNLFKRLFTNEKKKILAQQLIVFSFYLLLTFMIVNYQAMSVYSNRNENIFDIEITYHGSQDTGIDLSQIQNVTTALPEVKNMSLEDRLDANVIFDLKQCKSRICAINTSIYSEKDLGWNHFIGITGDSNRNILSQMNNGTIIISQKLADQIGARVGDYITLDDEDFLIGNGTGVDVIIENLEVVGISDMLPKLHGNVYYSNPCAIIDFKIVDDLRRNLNSTRIAQTLRFDLEYETENETLIQILQSQTLDSFIEILNLDLLPYVFITINSASYNNPSNVGPSYYDIYLNFLRFEIAFEIIFLPIITLIFNKKILSSINSKFQILGSRGFDDKLMRRHYRKEVFSSIIAGNILGIVIGITVCLMKLSYSLPSLFLIGNFSILIEAAILILLSIIIGLGTLGMLNISLNKNLKTLKDGG